MIRLYGIEKGNSSWPRVTEGVRMGLRMLGQHAGFYDVRSVDRDYDDNTLKRGHDAPVGLCVGPPPSASVMLGRGHHVHRLLMIATNSTWLPETMMDHAAKMVTGFVGTSSWASSVIENYAHGKPVYTYNHGVSDDFRPPDVYKPKGSFGVVHLSSTHMERKGTTELIMAWGKAMAEGRLPADARLTLVVDGPRGYFLDPIHKASGGNISIADSYDLQQRLDLSPEEMRDFYCNFHVVCQPSRSEGFGLCPIEARACGVPVITTSCTGHADHEHEGDPGVVIVRHGPDGPVDDGPGALAPMVCPDDIVEALCWAHINWQSLADQSLGASSEFRRINSWVNVTAKFLSAYGSALGVA